MLNKYEIEMRKLSAIGLMIACGVLLGACEKDSDKDDDGVVWMEEVLDAVYVVNAGNAAASIPASITVVDVRNRRATQNMYRTQNGSDMVSTPSDMVTAWLSKRIFVVYPRNRRDRFLIPPGDSAGQYNKEPSLCYRNYINNVATDSKIITSLGYHIPFLNNHRRSQNKAFGTTYQFYIWRSKK